MDDKPGVPDHHAKLRLKPFEHGTPSDITTRRLEVDADKLEKAIVALTGSVRDGSSFDLSLLTKSGLPTAIAERVVKSAREADR